MRHDLGLALLGVALVMSAWVHYLWTIAESRVPRRPVVHALAQALGVASSIAAIAWGPATGGGLSWAAVALAPVSVGMGVGFLWLLPQAPLPDGELVVGVGDPLPAFAAWDHRGEHFDSAELAGDRVLLKFFRGHW